MTEMLPRSDTALVPSKLTLPATPPVEFSVVALIVALLASVKSPADVVTSSSAVWLALPNTALPLRPVLLPDSVIVVPWTTAAVSSAIGPALTDTVPEAAIIPVTETPAPPDSLMVAFRAEIGPSDIRAAVAAQREVARGCCERTEDNLEIADVRDGVVGAEQAYTSEYPATALDRRSRDAASGALGHTSYQRITQIEYTGGDGHPAQRDTGTGLQRDGARIGGRQVAVQGQRTAGQDLYSASAAGGNRRIRAYDNVAILRLKCQAGVGQQRDWRIVVD